MKTNIIVALLAVSMGLMSCTSVSSDRMTMLGTDGENVVYQANRNTGEVSFVAGNINNSNAFEQTAKTAKFGLGIWGATSIADSIATAVTNKAKVAAAENVDIINAQEATNQAQIAAEVDMFNAETALKEAELFAP